MSYSPLPKKEVINAIERKNPSRIPLINCKWWGEGLDEQYGEQLNQFEKYPDDALMVLIDPMKGMEFKTGEMKEKKAHDAAGLLSDWDDLDDFIAALPDPGEIDYFTDFQKQVQKAHREDRYLLFGWWRLFFERPWGLRGMENILMDYYLHPQKVHKLHQVLAKHYGAIIKRAVDELDFDGFWTSDDLGHQEQLMMKPEQFQEFIKPYYIHIADICHRNKKHFWLHSCGDNTAIMDDLIQAGVDVFHPVQKHAMDEEEVAEKFGDRMNFLAGIDVQHVLQEGTPADVRKEVRYLIDTFDHPEGGMCLAAGNGIVGGTPLENIEAFLDEACKYGKKVRKKYE